LSSEPTNTSESSLSAGQNAPSQADGAKEIARAINKHHVVTNKRDGHVLSNAKLTALILSTPPVQAQASEKGQTQRIAELEDCIDRDLSGMAAALAAAVKECESRRGMAEGRGSYEWDDDEYRKEFGWAIDAIQKICREALETSGKVKREALKPSKNPSYWTLLQERELMRAEMNTLQRERDEARAKVVRPDANAEGKVVCEKLRQMVAAFGKIIAGTGPTRGYQQAAIKAELYWYQTALPFLDSHKLSSSPAPSRASTEDQAAQNGGGE
jgi:hypothetical protein